MLAHTDRGEGAQPPRAGRGGGCPAGVLVARPKVLGAESADSELEDAVHAGDLATGGRMKRGGGGVQRRRGGGRARGGHGAEREHRHPSTTERGREREPREEA
jgi:hypothetical protein